MTKLETALAQSVASLELECEGLRRELRKAQIELRLLRERSASFSFALANRRIAPETPSAHALPTGDDNRYEYALEYIYTNVGAVCHNFQLCKHPACNASYTAWHIANEALRHNELPRAETRNPLRED